MKLDELLHNPTPLLEGKLLSIYNWVLPQLLLSEDGDGGGAPGGGGGPMMGGPPAGPGPGSGPAGGFPGGPPPGGGNGPPMMPGGPLGGPGGQPGVGWHDHGHGMGGIPLPGWGNSPAFGGLWFNQLYTSVKSLITAKRIKKRLKQLGISGTGAERVETAAKTAAKNVKDLLSNPRATAYNIPMWTTKKPPKTVIKTWNEHFGAEFEKELALLTADQINESASPKQLMNDWIGTSVIAAGKSTVNDMLDAGRVTKNVTVSSAQGKVHVMMYTLQNKKMVRIEWPDGKFENWLAR